MEADILHLCISYLSFRQFNFKHTTRCFGLLIYGVRGLIPYYV